MRPRRIFRFSAPAAYLLAPLVKAPFTSRLPVTVRFELTVIEVVPMLNGFLDVVVSVINNRPAPPTGSASRGNQIPGESTVGGVAQTQFSAIGRRAVKESGENAAAENVQWG